MKNVLYFPLHKSNAQIMLQFNTFKKKTCLLGDIYLLDINPLNGLKNFYIAIKSIRRVKKKTMFQKKMENFKGR